MPAHFGEMRPCGLTSVISVMTRPAQPSDILPRCIRCQSLAEPLLELYWHIGDTTTRFGNVRPRMVRGEKRALAIGRISFWCGEKGGAVTRRYERHAWRRQGNRSPRTRNIR